eukprot:scaffold12.g8146.t1
MEAPGRSLPQRWRPEKLASQICFDDGAQPGPLPHGTLTTDGISGASPADRTRAAKPRAPAEPEAGMRPRAYTSPQALQAFATDLSDIPGAAPAARDSLVARRRSPRRNPLVPTYVLPPCPEPEPEVPRFLRDAMSVADIAGAAPRQDARAPRPSRWQQDAVDVEGSTPGWRPHHLRRFGEQPRDGLAVDDIVTATPGFKQLHQQLTGGGSRSSGGGDGGDAGNGGGGGDGRGPPSPHPPARVGSAPAALPSARVLSDVGVARRREWFEARCTALRAATAAQRAAWTAAEGSLASGAGAAGAAGLAQLVSAFQKRDREGSGRLRADQFADVLRRGGLGLQQAEVALLVSALKDPNDLVDWRPFASRLCTKLQAAAPGATAGLRVADWHAARQRRLQTRVGQLLGQTHAALAEEAAEVPGARREVRRRAGCAAARAARPAQEGAGLEAWVPSRDAGLQARLHTQVHVRPPPGLHPRSAEGSTFESDLAACRRALHSAPVGRPQLASPPEQPSLNRHTASAPGGGSPAARPAAVPAGAGPDAGGGSPPRLPLLQARPAGTAVPSHAERRDSHMAAERGAKQLEQEEAALVRGLGEWN